VKQLENRGASETEIAAAASALDPEILTIGFARRFASYKRATLLLRDGPRLKKILNNPGCPVQIMIAGKAHPHDSEGKELIRQIIHFARDPEVRHRIVFLEDYDISVARYLVEGVDVWLNTPRRPNEASGTSGMKLLANGGLNLSILDGWWDEGYDREVGWAIGRGEEYDDPDYQNRVESESLFNLLENDVVPLFYKRDAVEIPRGWVAKMKASMKRLSPVFSTNRMVAEYTDRFYIPAHARHLRLASDRASRVHSLVAWRRRVLEYGGDVKIVRVETAAETHAEIGAWMKVTAQVQLGRLSPSDVRLQIYLGPLDAEGVIQSAATSDMTHMGAAGGLHMYEGGFECKNSGSCGLSVRVVPFHEDALVPYELPWVHWAE
jgi:starch phosphorylase